MNQLIDDILSEMKLKHGVTKFELEKIIDSQFKVLQTSIQNTDYNIFNSIKRWESS